MKRSGRHDRKRGFYSTMIALGVLVLAAVLTLIVSLLRHSDSASAPPQPAPATDTSPPSANAALVDTATTAQVRQAVDHTAAKIFSYHSTTAAKHSSAAQHLVSGAAVRKVAKIFGAITAQHHAGEISVHSTVSHSAVIKLAGGRAQVLVFLDELVSGGGKSQQGTGRLRINAARRDGSWRITDIDDQLSVAQPRPNVSGAVANGGPFDPAQTAAQRDLLLTAAMLDSEVLTSDDYRTPGQSIANSQSLTTGGLHQQIVARRAANTKRIANSGQISTGRTVAAGVSAMNLQAGTATVLCAVNETRRSKSGSNSTASDNLVLTMRRTGGRWLVSKLDQL
ncbi:MAG: hypothetical protein ACRDRL_32985 [Sciscionella sp.]